MRHRILILSSAVFHKPGVETTSADIYDAHAILRNIVGRGEKVRQPISDGYLATCTGAAAIFALALLCSGQSASLVATVAGQIVSEGFLRWRVSVSITQSKHVMSLPHGTYPS